jgi:hypothetical protein
LCLRPLLQERVYWAIAQGRSTDHKKDRSVVAGITYQQLLFTELLLRNGSMCHIAPSLRLFVPNSLQAYRHFFFSEGCAVTSLISLTFLPVAQFARSLLSNCPNSLQAYCHLFFSEGCAVTSLISPTFLPVAQFARCLLSNCPNSLQAYRHFLFSECCVVTSVISLTFLPVTSFAWCLLSNCSCCYLLKYFPLKGNKN